jgi:regulator of replication initiation timing
MEKLKNAITNIIQENSNLNFENTNLENEIKRKGDIIVRLLTVVGETGDQDLINKALLSLTE